SLLAIPAMVLGSTIASALHVERGVPWWSGAIALVLTLPLAFATRTTRTLALALASLLAAYAVFLGASPATVSLAALGPHPEGGGPGRVLSHLGHRLRLSWRGIVNKTDHLEIAVVSLVTLFVLALLRPRSRTLDALLVALAVSLVVNDSGFDILRFGALVAIA